MVRPIFYKADFFEGKKGSERMTPGTLYMQNFGNQKKGAALWKHPFFASVFIF